MQPNHSTDPYKAVSCDFMDELEALATLKKSVRLHVETQDGKMEWVVGHIQDFFVHYHADYLKLRDGTVVRLDKIRDWKEAGALPH